MSAAITAVAITAAATLYQAEQQRQAQSDADERIKQDKIAAGIEREWQNKKKAINDRNASMAALRLRGEANNVVPAGTIPGSNGAAVPIPGTIGVLGGIGAQQPVSLPPGTTSPKLNSPLGL